MNNARTHSKLQIREIANSIKAFGFSCPIIVDENRGLIAGHGRLAAASLLKLAEIPAIVLSGLSDAKKRALALADNRIAEKAGWDRERLSIELPVLSEMLALEKLDISITGFLPVEVDQIVGDFEEDSSDPADVVQPPDTGTPVTAPGDLWTLGNHRLLCGSALSESDLGALMQGERAEIAFLDPPYNVKISDIGGRGQTQHPEFAMASGEMSDDEFRSFLHDALERV